MEIRKLKKVNETIPQRWYSLVTYFVHHIDEDLSIVPFKAFDDIGRLHI